MCNCQDISKEPELNKRTRVKEHVHHSVGHHHGSHRNRPHRRKGEPRASFHTGGTHQWRAAGFCKTCSLRFIDAYAPKPGLQLHSL